MVSISEVKTDGFHGGTHVSRRLCFQLSQLKKEVFIDILMFRLCTIACTC